jgi:DNA-binding transcriptional regulator LsrR (DeoR family)
MLYLIIIKKYKHMTNTFTDLETRTLNSLIKQLYAEPGFSDVDANDISRDINIPTKQVRGALGSLVKKGVVSIHTNDSNYDIIYLNESYYHLHPEWSQQ